MPGGGSFKVKRLARLLPALLFLVIFLQCEEDPDREGRNQENHPSSFDLTQAAMSIKQHFNDPAFFLVYVKAKNPKRPAFVEGVHFLSKELKSIRVDSSGRTLVRIQKEIRILNRSRWIRKWCPAFLPKIRSNAHHKMRKSLLLLDGLQPPVDRQSVIIIYYINFFSKDIVEKQYIEKNREYALNEELDFLRLEEDNSALIVAFIKAPELLKGRELAFYISRIVKNQRTIDRDAKLSASYFVWGLPKYEVFRPIWEWTEYK